MVARVADREEHKLPFWSSRGERSSKGRMVLYVPPRKRFGARILGRARRSHLASGHFFHSRARGVDLF